MTEFHMPSGQDFLAESEHFLHLCEKHCRCANGWHFIWSAYKASGRRRSIYHQQPHLRQLLAPWLDRIDSVLVAGAADTGIVQVLSSLLPPQTRYHVFDLCAAPLEVIKEWGSQKGLQIECEQVGLQDFRPHQRHDLVFLSNTLCFLRPNEGIEVLIALKQALRPEGILACGMRYGDEERDWGPHAEARLIAELHDMTEQTFGANSNSARLVRPHVAAYAASRSPQQRPSYTPEIFEHMLKEARFQSVANYTDQLTPAAVLNPTPHHQKTRSDVHLLVPS